MTFNEVSIKYIYEIQQVSQISVDYFKMRGKSPERVTPAKRV